MTFLELFLTGIGLSMDAFAVSICKGLSMKKMSWKNACIAGLYFGGFQALMPLLGYLAGTGFYQYIQDFDHWIVFILLTLIGLSMIKEALAKECDARAGGDFSPKKMLPLALATSIDALAVGVSFAFLKVNIWIAITIIGCTTFVFGALGIWIGRIFGDRFRSKAELLGGCILILIGVKILLEHLGVISF